MSNRMNIDGERQRVWVSLFVTESSAVTEGGPNAFCAYCRKQESFMRSLASPAPRDLHARTQTLVPTARASAGRARGRVAREVP